MTGNHVGSTLGSSNLPLGAIKGNTQHSEIGKKVSQNQVCFLWLIRPEMERG